MEKNNDWLGHTYNSNSIKNCINKIKDQFGQQFSDSQSIREQHTHTMTIHKSELPDGVLFKTFSLDPKNSETSGSIEMSTQTGQNLEIELNNTSLTNYYGINNPNIKAYVRSAHLGVDKGRVIIKSIYRNGFI